MDDILWQPKYLGGESYEFKIDLNYDFADELMAQDPPEDYQDVLNTRAEDLLERNNFEYPNPVRFHDETLLASSIHLGRNGTWIASTNVTGRKDGENMIYNSHNVDTAYEAHALIRVFDNWARMANTVLESDDL